MSASLKNTAKRMKRQATYWEKIFTNSIFNERLVTRIYKEPSKLSNKKLVTTFFLRSEKFQEPLY
jgi:hypothetical protein